MFYIRPSKPSDLTALHTLDVATNSSAWSPVWWQATLTSRHDTVLVATNDNDSIVGFIAWQHVTDEWELHLIATQPEYRKQGIASTLLQKMFQAATKHNASRILLEVRLSNQNAQQLYTQQGFSQIAVRPRYYRDGEDGVIMEKLC
ncbi:ribosomal protein S18-alanine N-acetyltransferase [Kingella negevensis]|uniref:[Ribosomal protein bS18]-alanine N-acetyltransferase n=1 Tax=Kingella negevensis TaxID=1522312 RepID=A0A238TF92_9NEIS|nr:ribosomal protein S18-alanine N-acetyltransferase [Kingella negevensis]MDK4696553.1 ribosomal protein S18-alanine N-acetyltransferase [Kingella negevensis]SNB77682.1 ribosomal-protein-alanine N-acetyltransferase [Kingella negevensis]